MGGKARVHELAKEFGVPSRRFWRGSLPTASSSNPDPQLLRPAWCAGCVNLWAS
jgi:hypothetical protein